MQFDCIGEVGVAPSLCEGLVLSGCVSGCNRQGLLFTVLDVPLIFSLCIDDLELRFSSISKVEIISRCRQLDVFEKAVEAKSYTGVTLYLPSIADDDCDGGIIEKEVSEKVYVIWVSFLTLRRTLLPSMMSTPPNVL